ncbi:MAG: hypothetical protein PHV59_09700 [Victivallales bacterium]|nr:hypothetical protein [Victivallales bacterium]
MKAGFECKLYRGAAGAKATTEVDTAKDVTPGHDIDQVEASNRKSAYKKYLQGMVDAGVEWAMDFDKNDAHCMAFLAAAINRTDLAIYAELDTGIGLDMDCRIFTSAFEQPLSDSEKITFQAKPSATAAREPNFLLG